MGEFYYWFTTRDTIAGIESPASYYEIIHDQMIRNQQATFLLLSHHLKTGAWFAHSYDKLKNIRLGYSVTDEVMSDGTIKTADMNLRAFSEYPYIHKFDFLSIEPYQLDHWNYENFKILDELPQRVIVGGLTPPSNEYISSQSTSGKWSIREFIGHPRFFFKRNASCLGLSPTIPENIKTSEKRAILDVFWDNK
jgi:hypothetical protein